MVSFKIKNKNNQILVISKLSKTQQINDRDYNTLTSKTIRGIMKPTVVSSRKIEYLSTSGKSLRLFLSGGISLNDFYLVFAQIIEIAKVVTKNALNLTNLLLDLNYSFINIHTKEVHFIYQPLQTNQYTSNLPNFLCEVIINTRLETPQEYADLNQLDSLIRSTQNFTLELVENYIIQKYPQIYKQIPRQKPGQSQMLKGDDIYYRQDRVHAQVQQRNTYPNGNSAYGSDFAQKAAGYDDCDTALLVEDDATSLLKEDVGTALLTDDETSLLIEEDGTALLDRNRVSYPYLIRVGTYDRTDVNKPVFRIGKERSYVDYFVQNNSAVSRLHADIITKGHNYYIKDNNSTNGTFVNGAEIPIEKEVQIFDGDEIVLANEAFEFHII